MAVIVWGYNAAGNAQTATVVATASLSATATYNYNVIAVVLDNTSAYITRVYDNLGNPPYQFIGAVNGTGIRVELWAGVMLYSAASCVVTATANTSCNLAINATNYSNVYYTSAASPFGTYTPVLTSIQGGSQSNTATLPTVIQGNLICVAVSYEGAYSAAHTLTDAFGTVYTRAGYVSTSGSQILVEEIWDGYAGTGQTSGSNDLLTYTTGLSYTSLSAMQFQNGTTVTDGAFVTGSANSGGSGLTLSTGSGITTTNANDIIFVGAGTWSQPVIVVPPYSSPTLGTYSGAEIYLPNATGTYTPTMTQSSFSTWAMCALALQTTWSQTGVIVPRTASLSGSGVTVGSLVGSIMRGMAQTTDSSGWVVSGMGWNCQSGDALGTALYGTARGSSIPAATASAVLLMDSGAPQNMLAQLMNEESITTNRNWATFSMEIRGSGGTVFQPTFASVSGGVLPVGGAGQIFPPSIKQQ